MRLLVIDEIHLLGDERGPVLEVIVSRTNFIASHTEHPVRVIGLSTALANARDLADWLGIKQVWMQLSLVPGGTRLGCSYEPIQITLPMLPTNLTFSREDCSTSILL